MCRCGSRQSGRAAPAPGARARAQPQPQGQGPGRGAGRKFLECHSVCGREWAARGTSRHWTHCPDRQKSSGAPRAVGLRRKNTKYASAKNGKSAAAGGPDDVGSRAYRGIPNEATASRKQQSARARRRDYHTAHMVCIRSRTRPLPRAPTRAPARRARRGRGAGEQRRGGGARWATQMAKGRW